MSDSRDEYKQWILSADPHALIRQLHREIREPLGAAQNLVNLLWLISNPSPQVQKRIESGELDQEQMITQVAEHIDQVFGILDFFRSTLDEGA